MIWCLWPRVSGLCSPADQSDHGLALPEVPGVAPRVGTGDASRSVRFILRLAGRASAGADPAVHRVGVAHADDQVGGAAADVLAATAPDRYLGVTGRDVALVPPAVLVPGRASRTET